MEYATLKETAKKLKMKEEEVEKLVELGVIKPPAYCYPANFGDGKSIAFFPTIVEEQIKAAKSKPKPEPEPEPEAPEEEEPEEEAPEEEDETVEAPAPKEPKDDKAEGKPKDKDKKSGKK